MCKWCVNDAKKSCLWVLRLSTPARTCPNHLLHPLQNYQPVTRWIRWMTELWYRQKCCEMLLYGWECSEHRRQHCDTPRYGGDSTVRIHDHEVTCCSACDTVAISIRPWWYQWQCCQVYHKVLYLILSGKNDWTSCSAWQWCQLKLSELSKKHNNARFSSNAFAGILSPWGVSWHSASSHKVDIEPVHIFRSFILCYEGVQKPRGQTEMRTADKLSNDSGWIR